MCIQPYTEQLAVPISQQNFSVPQHSLYTTMYVTTDGGRSFTDYRIQTEPLSRTNTTKKLEMAVTVVDGSQYFETTRKYNHTAIAPSANDNFTN